MLLHKPFPMLSSRDLRLHAAKMPGAFVRQGGARATASVTRCCAVPSEKPKKKASTPTTQAFNYFTGGVHFHIGDGKGQAAEWDAVAMSPEAKALLQRHAVKASTALKMHNVLGFEDVGDLQHLSSDLIAQLQLKPLQLEPLVHMLREQQQQQDDLLIAGMQGQQQKEQLQQEQQQQQQDGTKQPVDFSRAQDHVGQQQHTGQALVAGQTDATPSPGALLAADDSHAAAEDTWQAVPASAEVAAEGGMPPAAPAARAGAYAEPGTDGHTQAGGSLNKHACIAIMKVEAGAEGAVNCIAITPDGRRAVTAGPGSEVHVWDLEARSCIATLKGHTGDVFAVAITPDGRRAVSGSADKTLRVWDLDTHACTASTASRAEDSWCGWIRSVAITPDGQHVLYGDETGLCKWAMDYSAPRSLIAGDSVTNIAISSDGRLAVTGGHRGKVKLWEFAVKIVGGKKDPLSVRNLRDLDAGLEGRMPSVSCVAITPDGRHAVSASCNSTDCMRVWDLSTRTCIGAMEGHQGIVSCVAITPDGRRAVSGGMDSKLRVWDLATFTCTGIMEGHCGAVMCVAITPDGRHAVSASYDDDLRMWDLGPSSAHSKAPAGSPP